jgi:hypothetical protein
VTTAIDEGSIIDSDVVLFGGGPAVVGLLVLAMARRKKRIKRDAARMIAELDLSAFSRLAQRTKPDRTAHGAPHALSYVRTGDGFTAEAIRRASDLLPLLSREQGAALMASIEALMRGQVAPQRAEQSIQARCIVEADPKQKLRFDLLAIEGQLEAHAASQWLAELEAEAAEPDGKKRARVR